MSLQRNLVQTFIVLAAVMLFLFFINLGYKNAQSQNQSQVILANMETIRNGLQLFYKDYDRFPQAAEFLNNQLMLDYFSIFPPHEFVSANCNQAFNYKRRTLDNSELNFCLPSSHGNLKKGWNQIIVTKK